MGGDISPPQRTFYVPIDVSEFRGVQIQERMLIYEAIIDEDGTICEVYLISKFELGLPPGHRFTKQR